VIAYALLRVVGLMILFARSTVCDALLECEVRWDALAHGARMPAAAHCCAIAAYHDDRRRELDSN
jgi:hypothetical protein